MNILICLIGIGNYAKLIDRQYQGIQKYFLPKTDKNFILFSDREFNFPRTLYVNVPRQNWLGVIHSKFSYLNNYASYIDDFDWFVSFDADIDVLDTITEDEFFCHDKLFFGMAHPTLSKKGAFEENPKCRAYVSKKEDRSTYWQAFLWGGKGAAVNHLISRINADISFDSKQNVVAKWNDESYLNRFFIDNKKDLYTFENSDACAFGFGHDAFFNKKMKHKNFQWLEKKGKL